MPTDGKSSTPRSPSTIYDVALAAGVSPSTVSRALNKPGRVNAATEQRIRAHADALGYQLNPMARAVITGRTDTIALVLSDITNPVYFGLIRGSERVAAEHGKTLVIAESQESAEFELTIAQKLRVSVDGIVLVGSRLSDQQIASLAESKRVVVVNRRVEGAVSVVPEISSAVERLLDHLAEMGHRSVAYLSGPPASWINGFRWASLFDRALERGVSIVELPSSAPTLHGGRDALRRVLASGATAVVAYNDLLAMGLMAQCRSEAIRVPGRLSIVGFDDIFGADLVTPSLSTVRTPVEALGSLAVEALLAGGLLTDTVAPSADFIARDSTAPVAF